MGLKKIKYLTALFACGAMFVLSGSLAAFESLSESKKIEMLIAKVENSGGVFVRNGSEYSASAAAAHMRFKLSRAGSRIKTARQFIEYVGTGSSMTGVPYELKFPDGREYNSADWLTARLAEIEEEHSGAPDECCSIQQPVGCEGERAAGF